jgi:two-component system, NtrC family, response regulator AtoC
MTRAPIHVLCVDDDETSRGIGVAFLEALGYKVEAMASGEAALERLAGAPTPDVILLDVVMPEMDGIETLRRFKAAGGKVPVVMVSALDEADTVIQAMRLGASDYVTKPLQANELREILDRVVDLRPMRAGTSTSVVENLRTTQTPTLGVSPAMRRIDALLDRVADADVPILITGESGVGKDVVAREIHARSARRDRIFVKINCAALPETLLESELFGYERGAFTGAQRAKPGQFELADGGTLFLDEIGEMPVSLQAKLLQALQDGEFYRVGGQRKVRVDVRVIVATNRDLERCIKDGSFREDLYYRLNVVHLRIPSLRERREDVPQLLAYFVDKYSRRYGRSADDVPPEVVARFLSYDWPGNVRELENLVRRLMVLRDPSFVYAEMRQGAAAGTASGYQDVIGPSTIMPTAASDSPPTATPAPPVAPPPTPALSQPQAVAMPSPGPAEIAAATALIASVAPPPPSVPARVPVVQFPSPPYAVPAPAPVPQRGGSYPFGGYASEQAGRPLGEVVAEEFANAGEEGRVDLKALGRKAAEIVEREAIVAMLARTGGSKREAADRLGISYKAILYKIREYGIGRPRGPRRPRPAEAAAKSPVVHVSTEPVATPDESGEEWAAEDSV